MLLLTIFTLLCKHGLTVTLTDSATLPSSCVGLEDGLHYIQPLSNAEYAELIGETQSQSEILAPIVTATCHQGYTIIDVNQVT